MNRARNIDSRFARLFGYSPDEVRGKQLMDTMVPPDLIEEGEMLNKKAEEGTPIMTP
jgi:PAS domain S-box-containing protein